MNQKKIKLDFTNIKKTIKTITIDKWLLMGAAGIVLVLCSDSCQSSLTDKDGKENISGNINAYSSVSENTDTNADGYVEKLEKRLEDMLCSVEGAGKVKVMITLKSTSQKEVLTEEPYTEKRVSEDDGDGGSRDTYEKSQDYNVIFQENTDGGTIPFVVSESSPKVEGVAVIAEGGDSPVVKEKITNIIKALFGIEINKIAVGKMK